MATPRLTGPTVGVLEVLLSATADDPAWGYRIFREADLTSGTVYPILSRLLECGWVRSWSEAVPPSGRPARKYYRLTEVGRLAADVALKERAARQARHQLHMQEEAPA